MAPLEVTNDLAGGIMAGNAGDAAARMGAGATKIKPCDGHTVIGMAQHRTGREQLVETELTVKDVAVRKSEAPFQIQRRKNLARENRAAEVRCVSGNRVDYEVGKRLALGFILPTAPIGKMRRRVLHEEARYVSAGGGQHGVDRRGDEHFDNGLRGPAVRAGVEVGALEIAEGWADDDAGAMMRL